MGNENGEFLYPYGICCDDKHIIVCDLYNERLQIFDLNGNVMVFHLMLKIFGNLIYVTIFNENIYLYLHMKEIYSGS